MERGPDLTVEVEPKAELVKKLYGLDTNMSLHFGGDSGL